MNPITQPISPELLANVSAYWRAANHLSVGQIYLFDNPLLKAPPAVVQFSVPEEGNYVMVDHHFANPSQGAIGLIASGGKPDQHAPSAADTEHHNIPATATPTDPAAVSGKLSFDSKCLACHSVGGGDKLGPDVYGVTRRREETWLARWMKNPEQMRQEWVRP